MERNYIEHRYTTFYIVFEVNLASLITLNYISVLFLGGTHSTLQDIKLPQKAGGYWYKDSKKICTRNRFIYW